MKNINFYFPRIDPTKILRWSIGFVFMYKIKIKLGYFPGAAFNFVPVKI